MNKKRRKPSLFVQYVVVYIVLVLIACLLIGAVLSSIYLNSINTHIIDTKQQQAAQVVQDLEAQIEPMHRLSLELSIQRMFRPEELKESKNNEINMLEALSQYTAYANLASEYALIYADMPESVFLNSGYKSDLSVFLNRHALKHDEKLSHFLFSQTDKGRVYVGQQCLMFAYSIGSGTVHAPYATLCFAVTPEDLIQRVNLSGNMKRGTYQLYYQGELLLGDEQTEYIVTAGNTKGFEIRAAVSQMTFGELIATIFRVPVLIAALVLLMFSIMLLAYYCYSPVRSLVRKYEQREDGAKARNELVVLDELIEQMKDYSATLFSQSAAKTALMRNYLLLMLLNNASTQNMSEDFKRTGIDFPYDNYFVITLRPLDERNISSADIALIADNMYEFSDENALLYAVECDPARHVLALVCNVRDASQISTIEQHVRGYLNYQPVRYVLGVGQCVSVSANVAASYLTAMTRMSENKSSNEEKLSRTATAPGDLQSVLMQLCANIRQSNTAAALLNLSYYHEFCSEEVSELMRRYNLFNLKRSVQALCEENDFSLSNEHLSILLTSNNSQPTYHALQVLIPQLCEHIRAKNYHSALPLSDMVIDYIKLHFCEYTMSAHQISEAMGIGINRTNAIIREKTGLTCKAYLTQLRMEKARELLYTGNDTVSDIGEAIGYGSTSHFIKIFRDTYGQTPDAFRKQIKE